MFLLLRQKYKLTFRFIGDWHRVGGNVAAADDVDLVAYFCRFATTSGLVNRAL